LIDHILDVYFLAIWTFRTESIQVVSADLLTSTCLVLRFFVRIIESMVVFAHSLTAELAEPKCVVRTILSLLHCLSILFWFSRMLEEALCLIALSILHEKLTSR
jgi:hypothetical protein